MLLTNFFEKLFFEKLLGNGRSTTHRIPRSHLNRDCVKKQQRSPVHYETLESRSMLAVDLIGSIGNQVLAPDDPALKIDLADFFDETTITGSVVQMAANIPDGEATIYLELFDKPGAARERITPLTASNFLTYVDADAYDGSIIHRSVSSFVVQGGGFLAPTVPADQLGSDPQPITTANNILNEPGNSNVIGTLAMAKRAGDPNSANSQWFVNLADNLFLDADNGGFTVFGRVLGNGMNVVESMAAAPVYDAKEYYGNGALNELPLWHDPRANNNVIRPEDFLTLQFDRASEVTYSFTYTSPDVLDVSLNGSKLVLLPQGRNGSSTITLRATSVADPSAFAEQSFEVQVGAASARDSLFALTSGARWVLSRNTGEAFETATFAQWNPDVAWTSPVVGDFNGDGLTDVAARTHYGQWWAAINQGDGSTVNWKGSYWGTNVTWHDITVGDFNGDGRDDIAGRTDNGAWFAALASDADTFTNRFLALWDANTEWTDVLTGDFNNDGKSDIAGRNSAGQWHVISTDTKNEIVSAVAGSWTNKLDWSHVMPGDFNGDGRTDIVGRASNGLWYAALSLDRTTPVLDSVYMGAWAAIEWNDVRVGDLNGDGRSDILGRTSGGSWWAGLSSSSHLGFTNSYMGQWAPIEWAAVSVGDFNGDSRTDIIGRVAANSTNPLWVGLSVDGRFSTAKWGNSAVAIELTASFVGRA